jgi:hypothetical protein
MSVILAIQEAEIRRIKAQSQPRQTVCETQRAGGVAQGVGPEFKSQYHPKKKKKKKTRWNWNKTMYFSEPSVQKAFLSKKGKK